MKKHWIVLFILVVILGTLAYLSTWTVDKVQVEGCEIVNTQSVSDAMKEEAPLDNTLLLYIKSKMNKLKDLSFVSKMDLELTDKNTVTVTVYEKSIAGCVLYKGDYVYFDKDGIVLDSSKRRVGSAPLIKGLTFTEWSIGKKLPSDDDKKFQTILTITQLVEKYDLDGIDIDWEYPCNDAAGIGADPRDKENFTALLTTLREYLGKDRIVSIAVGASQRCIADTQMDKVAGIVDYVQLMTYDMVDGTRAGHHAALGATKGDKSGLNTRDTVEAYHRAGVPYEKIIIGAAFYGRHFAVTSFENHGLLQPSGGGLPGPAYGEITPEYLRENNFQIYWDADAEANYLWNGKTLVSYESPKAVRLKCKYVKEKKLLGIMYWEHGNDPTRELLGAIADEIQ